MYTYIEINAVTSTLVHTVYIQTCSFISNILRFASKVLQSTTSLDHGLKELVWQLVKISGSRAEEWVQ